jgi:protocatechuate 3,4-dioxygenase beta subunit
MPAQKRFVHPENCNADQLHTRRAALRKIGALGLTGLFGTTGMSASMAGPTGSTPGSCVLIPTETSGPYPLLAILSNTRMVRKDIREDKPGIPLTLELKLLDIGNACKPIPNAAVYIWQCDKDGQYSGYSNGENGNHADETYLRGIQVSDADGLVNFTTIFPGWYPGRITHIHFQIYLNNNLTSATSTVTSQLTFPLNTIQAVYGTPAYRTRGQNTSVTTYRDDGVFSDGETYQVVAVSGEPTQTLRATLAVGLST